MYDISVKEEDLKANDYATAKIEKFITKKDFGVEEFILGGNVTRIAKIEGKEVYLLLDKTYVKTIGVATSIHKKEEIIKQVEKKESVVACEKCGKEFKNEFALKGHMRFCKK